MLIEMAAETKSVLQKKVGPGPLEPHTDSPIFATGISKLLLNFNCLYENRYWHTNSGNQLI